MMSMRKKPCRWTAATWRSGECRKGPMMCEWIRASAGLVCIILFIAGCSRAPDAMSMDDLPSVPGLSLYEGAQEIVLDSMTGALRAAIDTVTWEAGYYWDPDGQPWVALVQAFGERIESEGWQADMGRSLAGLAVWTRAAQRLVLAEVPQPSGGRIVAVVLTAP